MDLASVEQMRLATFAQSKVEESNLFKRNLLEYESATNIGLI